MTGAGLLLPFWWDTQKLRALQVPVEEMPVACLDWHLTWRCWALEGHPFMLSPAQVLREPDRYTDQAKRIAEADLRFPIDVTWWKGRWTIMDGVHRLARATSIGRATVDARQVSPGDLRQISREKTPRGAMLETLTARQLMTTL